jgi:hypothetical protein
MPRIQIPRRYIIIASSVALILIIAISLGTSMEIRAPSNKLIQISMAQAAKLEEIDTERKAGARVNGTGFDRVDIYSGTSTVKDGVTETYIISRTPTPTITTNEGMIGETKTPAPTPTEDAGYIGPIESESPAVPTRKPATSPPQFPILALSYSGAGGPKHCRGELLQKLTLPPPASSWRNGTCVDLPADARCGVFIAGKDDNCEAQLFTTPNCYNTSMTYVNTVVFMPEERVVGAIWRSFYVRCGIDAPEAGLIDPSILNGLLKKPGGG